MVKSWSITKEETPESGEDHIDSNTFLLSMFNHMYRRSCDDESFRKRLVKVLEQIKDDQTFKGFSRKSRENLYHDSRDQKESPA